MDLWTAYEKKYGTEAEREARREQQALAKVKAMSERETLERTEQEQLTLVIKASLAEVMDPFSFLEYSLCCTPVLIQPAVFVKVMISES